MEGAWVLWAGERPRLLHMSPSGLQTSLDYSTNHMSTKRQRLLTWLAAVVSYKTEDGAWFIVKAERYLLNRWTDWWVDGWMVGGWING